MNIGGARIGRKRLPTIRSEKREDGNGQTDFARARVRRDQRRPLPLRESRRRPAPAVRPRISAVLVLECVRISVRASTNGRKLNARRLSPAWPRPTGAARESLQRCTLVVQDDKELMRRDLRSDRLANHRSTRFVWDMDQSFAEPRGGIRQPPARPQCTTAYRRASMSPVTVPGNHPFT